MGDRPDPSATELARLLLSTLDSLSAECPGLVGMVDLGAADGALLAAVAQWRPAWQLLGVDVRPAPDGLPAGCRWRQAGWDVRTASWVGPDGRIAEPWADLAILGPLLVVGHEWLDELPCRVARREPQGWELLGPDGPTGARPDAAETAWLDRWAGTARVAEVGLTRDRAWAAVADRLPAGGVLVAVDYGHQRADRPAEGGLVGYRAGRRVAPAADGRTNLSAPVAIDALAAAVEARPGVRRLLVSRQRDLVAGAPAPATTPAPAPATTLAGLVAANRRRLLADPDRWGANRWLVHRVDSRRPRATS
ncbi:SAM-dependent methyltransferase [Raineyella sp.]|uniref:SAM-dependent methyltransferase n=1 Tax=Raineyella sp. TaxID=1911550 RepID=UPI002B220903|nr:SAM-dependent methyltransferase [Raineyella sp.]MEA5155459.1 hypothetical protein [Raineyella sp.]